VLQDGTLACDRGPPLKPTGLLTMDLPPMVPPDLPERIDVPISWVGYDEAPIVYANQFLLQTQPEGGFVMGIGQATPPALIGSPEEIAGQVSNIEFVAVRSPHKGGFHGVQDERTDRCTSSQHGQGRAGYEAH
jgi:hypothetical protein